jgi:plasmid stability protein
MVTSRIRNLDAAVVEKLKAHAVEHERSLEAAPRAILAREAERATGAEVRVTAKLLARAGTRPGARSDSTARVREDRGR